MEMNDGMLEAINRKFFRGMKHVISAFAIVQEATKSEERCLGKEVDSMH